MVQESIFQGKRVLVTGAAGFIGSHLVERLWELGASVLGVDNFISGQRRNLAELNRLRAERQLPESAWQFIEADVIQAPENYLPTAVLAGDEKIDLVLHFASPASPPGYQAHPIETYQVNSQATHLLLEWLRANQPQARFLFASTSEVYGDPLIHPQVESYWGNVNPNGKRSCYDEAKRLGETICGVHQRDFGMDVRIVRIFNTYGPRMDLHDGRVVPNFIKQALTGEPLTIYGDGSQTRSYCFVTDLVEGILGLAAGDTLSGQTVNLGNPGEYTALETAKIVEAAVTGKPAQPERYQYLPLPADDPTKRRPDISKAQQLLGWQPTIAFEAGLIETIEYFRQVI